MSDVPTIFGHPVRFVEADDSLANVKMSLLSRTRRATVAETLNSIADTFNKAKPIETGQIGEAGRVVVITQTAVRNIADAISECAARISEHENCKNI